jgi:hypothetical protein
MYKKVLLMQPAAEHRVLQCELHASSAVKRNCCYGMDSVECRHDRALFMRQASCKQALLNIAEIYLAYMRIVSTAEADPACKGTPGYCCCHEAMNASRGTPAGCKPWAMVCRRTPIS